MPKALRALDAALDEGGPGAVRAAVTVLAYRWGRPVEHMTITPAIGEAGDRRMLSDLELAALRQELQAQWAAAALPAGDA